MSSRQLQRSRSASRWAAWAFAFALLLKAAVPMMATASAHAQGKTLFQVCTVYGVATVGGADRSSPEVPSDPAASHAGDHCALSSLLGLAAPQHAPAAAPVALAPRSAAWAPAPPPAHDACAVWVAGLQHGPPPLS